MDTTKLPESLYPHFEGQKALLVDDDKFNSFIISEYLKPLQIDIQHAINGMAGLKLLKTDNSYSFMLVDLDMPLMDGATMLKEIHTKSKLNIPTIILSGYKLNLQDETLQLPFVKGYLLKPFVPFSLYKQLEIITQKR